MGLNIYMDNTKEFQVLLQTKVKVMARLALDKNLQLFLAYKQYEINQVNFIDFRNLVLMFNIWTLMWIILSLFFFFFLQAIARRQLYHFFFRSTKFENFSTNSGRVYLVLKWFLHCSEAAALGHELDSFTTAVGTKDLGETSADDNFQRH